MITCNPSEYQMTAERGRIVGRKVGSDVLVVYKTWKTANGKLIRLVDMDDHHLVAAIRMVEQRQERQKQMGLRLRWRQEGLKDLRTEAEKRGIEV